MWNKSYMRDEPLTCFENMFCLKLFIFSQEVHGDNKSQYLFFSKGKTEGCFKQFAGNCLLAFFTTYAFCFMSKLPSKPVVVKDHSEHVPHFSQFSKFIITGKKEMMHFNEEIFCGKFLFSLAEVNDLSMNFSGFFFLR